MILSFSALQKCSSRFHDLVSSTSQMFYQDVKRNERAIITKRRIDTCILENLATGLGFEPRNTASKAAVIPFHHPVSEDE
jgi:acetylornithine/succinyldiaminopimelate/putrescine aminotransferase